MFTLIEPVAFINMVLCILIAISSYFIYKASQNALPKAIFIAFTLFSLNHIFILLNLSKIIPSLFVALRISGYLFIAWAIFKNLNNKYKKYFLTSSIALITLFFTGIFFLFLYKKIPDFTNLFLIEKSINFLLCTKIIILSYLANKLTSNSIFKYIKIAFLIFAFSHISSILGFDKPIYLILVISRILAYFLIFIGVYSNLKETTKDKIAKFISSFKVQAGIVSFMVIILVSIFYSQTYKYTSTDPIPKIKKTKISTENYFLKEVKTGLFIKNFSRFDIVKNEFVMNAIVWFEFDPHQISLNTIEKFSFENGKIIKQEPVKTKIIGNKIWANYKVTVEFTSNLDYKLFPLEDHKIYIGLINTEMNPYSEILVSHNTDLSIKKNIYTSDWKNIGCEVEYGYIDDTIDIDQKKKSNKYPIVYYELDFQKSGIKKTLAIFLPLYMIFFLSLFSLIINIKNTSGILSLSVGSASALIFDLLAIESMSPDVRYFTIANKLFLIFLILSFLILLINVYSMKEFAGDGDRKALVNSNIILIRNFMFLFLAIFTILITYASTYNL